MHRFVRQISTVIISMAAVFYIRIRFKMEAKRRREAEGFLSDTDQLAEDVRAFRHQYNNLFQTVVCYIENEQWDLLKQYQKEILQITAANHKNNRLMLLKIRDYRLRNLLLQIVGNCKKNDFNLEILILGEIHKLSGNEEMLYQLLRFCWDNLYGEVKKSTKKEVIIKISEDDRGTYVLLESSIAAGSKGVGYFTKEYIARHPDWSLRRRALEKILKKKKNVILNHFIDNGRFRQEVMVLR